jgi:hypothetical protein
MPDAERQPDLEPLSDLVPRFLEYLARTTANAEARRRFLELACRCLPECEEEAA